MKRSLVKLGGYYAVEFIRPAYKDFPRVVIVRRCQIIDKRSNGRMVVQYDAMVPLPGERIGAKPARHQPGSKLAEVTDERVRCPWDEFVPAEERILDGRPKADRDSGFPLNGEAAA